MWSPKFPHTKHFCNTCETYYIKCGWCGNNCCNAGTGQLFDGSKCGCKEAYAEQDKMWKYGLDVK